VIGHADQQHDGEADLRQLKKMVKKNKQETKAIMADKQVKFDEEIA